SLPRAQGRQCVRAAPQWRAIDAVRARDDRSQDAGKAVAQCAAAPGHRGRAVSHARLCGRAGRDGVPARRGAVVLQFGRCNAGPCAALERTVQAARNAALAGTNEIEKKLVASLKRRQGTLVSQLVRARAALMPDGKPQERVLTIMSFLARYGGSLLDQIDAEVARWAAGL